MVIWPMLSKVCNGAVMADKEINYAEVAAALNSATTTCEGYSLVGLIDWAGNNPGIGHILQLVSMLIQHS